ncbi:hypothetical protein ABPG72_006850 [Tetrahymena utriculariae]
MNFKSFQTTVNLKKLFYFNIKIYNQPLRQTFEESDEENQEQLKSYLDFQQTECKEVNVGYYEILQKPKQPIFKQNKSDNHSDNFDFDEKYKSEYLRMHDQQIENPHYLQGVIQFKVEDDNNYNREQKNIILEDDQLFYCQNDNLTNLIKAIEKSYSRIVEECDDNLKQSTLNRDIQKLDTMKQFNKGSYSYFVIEKLKFREYKTDIGQTEYRYQIKSSESTDVKYKQFIIVASSDQQFQQHLHLLHKQDKLSAYSIQKTIEQRMDTIIYRSFKDIIRLCFYNKLDDQKEYGDFYQILTSQEQKKNKSYFKMKDGSKISLKEIKSVVYKNACIEGIFPFNIYLNTFDDSYIMIKLKLLLGKILSDNSYKLTHHLSTQVGNIFYSYDASNIFSIYKMQQKERSSSKTNEFTKIRVLDFFPLNQQIDEISHYIFNRLDQFDSQLMDLFSSFTDYEIINRCVEVLGRVQKIKELIGLDGQSINTEQKYEFLIDLLKDVEDILNYIKNEEKVQINQVNQFEFKRQIEAIEQMVNQLNQCFQGLENIQDISEEEQKRLFEIAYENEDALDNFKTNVLQYINTLYKTFLKYILTNSQVKAFYFLDQFSTINDSDEEEEIEENKQEIEEQKDQSGSSTLSKQSSQYKYNSNQQGDGSVYTLLLRRLGYYFLSHYFGQFKYFNSWPLIITDVEFKKYQLLQNNCQTSGISFAYQIKELLKEFIEPLFIPEQNQFFDFYDQYFKDLNENKYLSYKFKPVEQERKIHNQKKTNNQNNNNNTFNSNKNNIFESKDSVIKYSEKSRVEKNPQEKNERIDSIDLSIQHQKPSKKQQCQQQQQQQLVLDKKYKEFYFKSLIKSFQKYSSKINTILNQSIRPLILEKPLPYHQFYGEKMVYEYMNAIISKDDLILQVYKIIVKDFPETPQDKEKIKQVCFSVLGDEIVNKNHAFQVIVSEALKQVYNKPDNNASQQSDKEFSQDFLSTLFIIYDALYFMRNKSYIDNRSTASNYAKSGTVTQNNQFLEDRRDNNSSFTHKKPTSQQKIYDTQKKKYFLSYIRHQYKDFFKELAFYYFNSIRMKHSTFTSRDSLSYLGFLLIKDPEKRYYI